MSLDTACSTPTETQRITCLSPEGAVSVPVPGDFATRGASFRTSDDSLFLGLQVEQLQGCVPAERHVLFDGLTAKHFDFGTSIIPSSPTFSAPDGSLVVPGSEGGYVVVRPDGTVLTLPESTWPRDASFAIAPDTLGYVVEDGSRLVITLRGPDGTAAEEIDVPGLFVSGSASTTRVLGNADGTFAGLWLLAELAGGGSSALVAIGADRRPRYRVDVRVQQNSRPTIALHPGGGLIYVVQQSPTAIITAIAR